MQKILYNDSNKPLLDRLSNDAVLIELDNVDPHNNHKTKLRKNRSILSPFDGSTDSLIRDTHPVINKTSKLTSKQYISSPVILKAFKCRQLTIIILIIYSLFGLFVGACCIKMSARNIDNNAISNNNTKYCLCVSGMSIVVTFFNINNILFIIIFNKMLKTTSRKILYIISSIFGVIFLSGCIMAIIGCKKTAIGIYFGAFMTFNTDVWLFIFGVYYIYQHIKSWKYEYYSYEWNYSLTQNDKFDILLTNWLRTYCENGYDLIDDGYICNDIEILIYNYYKQNLPDCSKYHGLREFRSSKECLKCNVCKLQYDYDNTRFGCNKCQYHLCSKCYRKLKINLFL